MSTVRTNNVQVGQSLTATNNFTLYQPTVPDGTVRLGVGNSGATTADVLIGTSAGLLQFNSGYGSVATAYGCRAWVNFNGTGTVAIRASGNVSSITDNSVGNYTVNFSSPIADANYAASAAAGSPGSRDGGAFVPATAVPTTTALIVRCFGSNALDTSYDHTYVYVAVFR